MNRRLIVPGIFFAGFIAVFFHAVLLFLPLFAQAIGDPIAPGQAARAVLVWTFGHLGLPAAGAILGAWIAHAIRRFADRRTARAQQSPP